MSEDNYRPHRIARNRDGSYQDDIGILAYINAECESFVEHICTKIAPLTDIIDLDQFVCAKVHEEFDKRLKQHIEWYDTEHETLKQFAKELSQLSAVRTECEHCEHRNFNENNIITCDLVRDGKKCYLEENEKKGLTKYQISEIVNDPWED